MFGLRGQPSGSVKTYSDSVHSSAAAFRSRARIKFTVMTSMPGK
ncbi:hypothetical protein [Streptomyces goshikiensis]